MKSILLIVLAILFPIAAVADKAVYTFQMGLRVDGVSCHKAFQAYAQALWGDSPSGDDVASYIINWSCDRNRDVKGAYGVYQMVLIPKTDKGVQLITDYLASHHATVVFGAPTLFRRVLAVNSWNTITLDNEDFESTSAFPSFEAADKYFDQLAIALKDPPALLKLLETLFWPDQLKQIASALPSNKHILIQSQPEFVFGLHDTEFGLFIWKVYGGRGLSIPTRSIRELHLKEYLKRF